MRNEVYFGTVDGKDVYSVYNECQIIKVEKQNYNTYSSTTNTQIREYSDYYARGRRIDTQTKTNSVTHFKTAIYLDDNQVLNFNKDFNAMEGWHVRQNYIIVGNEQKLVDSVIVESGMYLFKSGFTASEVIQNFFIPYKAIYRNPASFESIWLWIACPCLYYLLTTAIPKILLISLPFNKGIFYLWGVITLLLTIIENISNFWKIKKARKLYQQETIVCEQKNLSIREQYTPLLQPADMMYENFMNYGFEGLNNFLESN